MADAIRLNCGIQKANEDKTSRSPLVVGAWRVFCYLCTLTYSLEDRFRFRGSQRGFLPSSLVFSLITRFGVILCLHLSFLLFKLTFYCLLRLNMA